MLVLPPGNILQHLYIHERIKQNKNLKSFLEIGSGNGYLSNELLSFGLNGLGCDLNSSACENNKRLNSGYINKNQYQVINEDFLLKKFEKKFDLIISSMVIEHLEDELLDRFFEKFKNILHENGTLILLVPSSMKHWGIEDEIAGHVKRYERIDFTTLAKKHKLEIVDLAGLTYPISNLLLSISNYLIRKKESPMKNMTMQERTVYTGNREIKYKTQYPSYFKFILNKVVLYPFHIIQKLNKKNSNSLILYCELIFL